VSKGQRYLYKRDSGSVPPPLEFEFNSKKNCSCARSPMDKCRSGLRFRAHSRIYNEWREAIIGAREDFENGARGIPNCYLYFTVCGYNLQLSAADQFSLLFYVSSFSYFLPLVLFSRLMGEARLEDGTQRWRTKLNIRCFRRRGGLNAIFLLARTHTYARTLREILYFP
jgi:hypothetical protein